MRSLLALILLLLIAGALQATDTYVCSCSAGADADCVDGSDANLGTLGNPLQTYEAARTQFGSMMPGDSVRFCRGGSWAPTGSARWNNGSCEASNRCLVTDYTPPWGSGDEGRPKIFRTDGQYGFDFSDGGNAERESGYYFSNLEIYGANMDIGEGIKFANDIDDVTIDNVLVKHFRIGVHIANSQPCSSDPECDGHNDRIILKNSDILENSSQGWLGSSSGSQILDNYFFANGSEPSFDHNIYVSGSSGSLTEGFRVAGNILYRSTPNADGECAGTPLVVHGSHNNMVIENNWVEEDIGLARGGCWGIAVDTGYSVPEIFSNLIIRNNHVINVGNLGIGVTSCVNCLIENNVIVHQQDHSFRAIRAPNRNSGTGDAALTGITVRNNSILMNSDHGGTGITIDTEGDQHVITSNAILYTPSQGNFDCLRAGLPPNSYEDINHNLCFAPNVSNAEWADQMGDLQSWQAATGFDMNSAATDPGYADPVLNDLSAADALSAMVNSGHPTLSSPIEIGGASRDALPDIGAYEWGVVGVFIDGFESGDTSRWSFVQ